jgi:hypothetical protein
LCKWRRVAKRICLRGGGALVTWRAVEYPTSTSSCA